MPQPGPYTVQASSEAWPNAGSQAERGLAIGWIFDQTLNSTGGEATNCSPSTATAFLSSGDGTTGSGSSFYALTRKLRVIHAGGTAYCRVTAASYAAPVTTVTVGDFQSGTTSLSTASITSVAAAMDYWGSSGYAPGNEAGLRVTGDMLYRDSTGVTRLAIGTSGQALFGGTTPQWAAIASAITQISHTAPTTAAVASIDITSISTAYNHLKLVFRGQTTNAGSAQIYIRFNNDSSANYEWERLYGADAGVTAEANSTATEIRVAVAGGSNATGYPSIFEAVIPAYAQQDWYKSVVSYTHSVNDATLNNFVGTFGGTWLNSTGVNRITLGLSAGNFSTGTTVTLYGMS